MRIRKIITIVLLGFTLIGNLIFVSPALAKTSHLSTTSKNLYYTNSSGNKVHTPKISNPIPVGATAKCRDNTYSFSQHRKGTCSYHGGVMQWLF